MRLPNGYGSITKLSGKRRKPFMVRITEGIEYDEETEDYYVKRAILGYYKTRQDALAALAEFNDNPFKLSDNNVTFGEIYDRWKKVNYEKLSKSSIDCREAGLKYCEPIKNMRIRDIKSEALKKVIDDCPHGSSTKTMIKTVMNTVFTYAMENDLVKKNYTEFLKIEYSEPMFERTVFTQKEIDELWKHSDEWDIQIILILLYSGMRVNELLRNKKENVNLEEKWIYVPKELAKKKASIRYVPIHDKIFNLVKQFYDRAEDELITNTGGYVVAYNNFVARNLKAINKRFNMAHRFHDTRHTFATMAYNYKLDDLCRKKILGHDLGDITTKIYTHITHEQLLEEINKIK